MDLSISLHYLRYLYPNSPLHGIGFSLGASVLSRYLGETSEKSILSSGIILGCPWDLLASSENLETNWFISRVYSKAMATNLLNMFFKHYNSNTSMFEDDPTISKYLPELKRLNKSGPKRLRRVDEVMVSKIGGPTPPWPFKGALEYYTWASPNQLIHDIRRYDQSFDTYVRPVLAINAFDDPIIDAGM
jgi:uncharacterized protein